MAKVLVTGGTGTLGRLLVPRLAETHQVRVLTRRPPISSPENVRYVRGDLSNGNGLMEATHAVDVIVHCASSPYRKTWKTDVAGTQRLVDAVRAVRSTPHFLYVSIVGVDRHPFKYYRAKRAAEELIEASGLPWTVLRTTQWHELVDYVLRSATLLGLTTVPRGFSVQPLAAGEVAARLARLVTAKPAGLLPDMGGPEVRTAEELAKAWAAANDRKLRMIQMPVPGKVGAAFRQGINLAPDRAVGRMTWESWLQKTAAAARAPVVPNEED